MTERIQRFSEPGADRYVFDFKRCSSRNGWAQVDTGQDASYFGTWANPTELRIVNYCEGDVTVTTCDSPADFVAEIHGIRDWNEEQGHGFKGIDAMCVDAIAEAFRGLGLGELLH